MPCKCHLGLIALTGFLLRTQTFGAETLVLNRERIHLRSGTVPEWAEFVASTPSARRLDLRFEASSNAAEATLFIRQDDVRQDWFVELNGKRLGKLFLMEADLVHTLPVPPGALKDGANLLSILPPRDNDDIVLRDIHIDPRPLTNALRDAELDLRVMDSRTRQGVPCRFTIVNEHGALAPVQHLGDSEIVATRPGVVYTQNGQAQIGLPPGNYTVYASRGLEWSVATQQVQVVNGRVPVRMQLVPSLDTRGWISCDTHVHTVTHSGHGDATVDERMLTLAGEGIELPIATDHNTNIDYTGAAKHARVAQCFTPVVGNEVTTPAGHFNIFPVDPAARVPNFQITDWPRLMEALRATPQVRVVVLNHPRNVHNQFQPFAATNFNAVSGDNLRGPEFTFDALEVINSSAQQSDYMLVYRDWFALLNHGYRITAVGSSDGHDVSRYIVGQGRTYIACGEEPPVRIDVAAACSNLLAGRALVSLGLLADMVVDGRYKVGEVATNLGAEVCVRVEVRVPPWASATNVSLFANGIKIRKQTLTGRTETVTWTIPRPVHDVHLVTVATGPGVTAPFWAIPRPYQPASPHWQGRVIASTNPIWIDGDGDGRFTAARGYAARLFREHGASATKLVSALERYDEAVAAQAASLCAGEGTTSASRELAEALKSGADQVRRGFSAYAAARP